jgi:hypothetical protein
MITEINLDLLSIEASSGASLLYDLYYFIVCVMNTNVTLYVIRCTLTWNDINYVEDKYAYVSSCDVQRSKSRIMMMTIIIIIIIITAFYPFL